MATTPKVLSGAGILFTDRRNFYLSPEVTQELWTSVAPFTTLVSNRNIVSDMKDPTFKLFEHRDPWIKQQFVTSSGSVAITANDSESNSLTLSGTPVGLPATLDASYVGLECEIWDSTSTTNRGQVVITSTNGSTTFKAKSLTGATITTAASDILVVVGNARGEGTTSPQAWSDDIRIVWGTTQIMRTPIEITGTLYQAALRGYSKELERLRMQKNKEHKIQKERAFLFGSNPMGSNLSPTSQDNGGVMPTDVNITDVNGNTVRTTLGLITALNKYGASSGDDQNIFTVNQATYKYSNFVDDMEKVFHYYPDGGVKYAFCGPGAMSYWSKLEGSGNSFSGKSGWTVRIGDMKEDSLGFTIRTLETPHGLLNLVVTPVLRQQYNNYMVVVSDQHLSLAQYRPMQFKANIKTDDGYDGVKDEFFSDEGLGLTLIESHKLFKIV